MRLNVIRINDNSIVIVIDKATDEQVEEWSGYQPGSITGVAGIVATREELEFVAGELNGPGAVLGVVGAVPNHDDLNAAYFKSGYEAGAKARVDPSLADNFADDGVVCFKPTPISLAELNVGNQQPTTIGQAVRFAVAQAGMSAPYGPGSGTFDSTSAEAIAQWAEAHIIRLINESDQEFEKLAIKPVTEDQT